MLLIETYLKPSEGKGIGLYAKSFIPSGYKWWVRNVDFDRLFSKEEFDTLPDGLKTFIKEYGFLEATGNWHLCIDNARFSNHSENPNTQNEWNDIGELMSCYAITDINPDEEILCNYREICITCIEDLGFENKE